MMLKSLHSSANSYLGCCSMADMADLSSYLCVGARGLFQCGLDETNIIATVRRRNGMIVWCSEIIVGHCVDPERMTRRYLARLYTGWIQTHIRRFGVPPGTQMLSTPL
jgi:hypothetical protein